MTMHDLSSFDAENIRKCCVGWRLQQCCGKSPQKPARRAYTHAETTGAVAHTQPMTPSR
jgi:hypothetical protein